MQDSPRSLFCLQATQVPRVFFQLFRESIGLRFYILLLVILSPIILYAFQSEDFYAQLNVYVATGNGTVYVDTKTPNTPNYQLEASSKGKSTSYEVIGQDMGLDPITFYLYANAGEDYYFDGWTQTESDVSLKIEPADQESWIGNVSHPRLSFLTTPCIL